MSGAIPLHKPKIKFLNLVDYIEQKLKYHRMRRAIYCLLFLLKTSIIFSQNTDTTTSPQTQLGKVVIRVGTVIKKEFVDVYSYSPKNIFSQYGGLEAKIINLTDASSGITISGLTLSNASEYSSYIDLEEIPGLLNFIELLNKIESEKPENYTEYIFNSKDLQIFAYFSSDASNKKSAPSWHYGIRTDKYYSKSQTRLELKTLNELGAAIRNSKSKFTVPPSF